MAFLKRTNNESGQVIPLPDGTTTIGRSRRCNINLRSPVVSKLHAVIECCSGTCMLRNESSKGTIINGDKLEGTRQLMPGDEIQIGWENLTYFESASPEVGSDSDRSPRPFSRPGDPDDSISHKTARPGRAIRVGSATCIAEDKVRGEISLRDQSIASLATTDSVRKLSQMLRLSKIIRDRGQPDQVEAAIGALYQFFPQASQIVLAKETVPGFQAFSVSLAHCRTASSPAMVCDDVIMQTARMNKCFLLADQWRDEPGEKPRLSSMGRVSLMSVPIQTAQGNCYAVLQMISGDPGPEFDIGDLERLVILAQLLAIVVPVPSSR
jgi:hypothetical protein